MIDLESESVMSAGRGGTHRSRAEINYFPRSLATILSRKKTTVAEIKGIGRFDATHDFGVVDPEALAWTLKI